MNQEVAIRINGLDMNVQKSQPPINDKNGVPYDLNDPEFPVVKDHLFKVRYWQMPRTAAFMLKYLNEHWDYFNKTRFHGALQKPKVELLRDVDALRMKLRGVWRPSLRELAISPNLFNAPHEGWVNRILIHEMCHEYVWEVHGADAAIADGKKTKGHGSLWAAAMRMAHLPPSRFDDTRNEMYMDKKELVKHKPVLDFREALRNLRATHLAKPIVPFTFCVFAVEGGEVKLGMIAGPSSVKVGRIWIAVIENGRAWEYYATVTNCFEPTREELGDAHNRMSQYTRAAQDLADKIVPQRM